ncbi:hypothetical protein K443DRAFT_14338 [Laccaria amethystina LaAM-08-1]|uniref:guanosine-diphosphatase n=1 Tax=Laccaria amethystina LaAM-08-1 TaxID=1095629 RepID=A0A0C9X1N4_9AGAR|nr:hypothetical protein K443DRAFT_14338 [Laccaria amethystina LaAM-08-1]
MAMLSSRSGNYDRLEGGIGRSRVGEVRVEEDRCGPRWSGVAIWADGAYFFAKLTKRLREKDTKRTQRLPLSKRNKPKNNNTIHPSLLQNHTPHTQTQPGLSSFAGNPEGAARSLDVLLDETLPLGFVYYRGHSVDILKAVEGRLRSSDPFQLQEKDGVVIMDRKDEDVYAWITANYLSGHQRFHAA